MLTKLLEIRDKATFIPVAATRLLGDNQDQEYLLRRVGLGFGSAYAVHLMRLTDGKGHHDWAAWGGRTMPIAHQYIEEHFDKLKDGEVVDVEFILGETEKVKVSERFE